jgi:uncharacterized damage-inducible protein DinB
MNPRVAPLADLYNLNTKLVSKTLKDLSDDVAHKRVNDTGTTLHWIIGHIANGRHYVAGLFNAGTEFENSELFNGGDPMKEPSEYPPIAEIKQIFESVSEKFIKRLEELTDDDINKKLKEKLPVDDDTMLAAISFFSLHESYHVGQLSYIRKQLGLEGLTG